MSTTLTWAGSEVKGVERDAGSVRVRFSAASVRLGRPGGGCHADEGHLRPLDLVFHGAQVEGDLAAALGTLAEGELRHGGNPWHQPALPLALQGGVSAELVFRNGTVLRIEGDGVTCAPGPDSVFQESMAC